MHNKRIFIALTFMLALSACYKSSNDEMYLPDTDPSFLAVVTRITHDTSFAPAGFQLDQYELFVARVPASVANAGLVLGPHSLAYRQGSGKAYPVSRATIAIGDTLSVWADTVNVAWNSVQAPEGAPAYRVDQVVIHP